MKVPTLLFQMRLKILKKLRVINACNKQRGNKDDK